MKSVHCLASAPFDVDVHTIPARAGVPEHLHCDVRFLFAADDAEPLVICDESLDLAWVALKQLKKDHSDASIQRLIAKTEEYYR